MERSDGLFSHSSLLCQEDESSFNQIQSKNTIFAPVSVSEYDEEYIKLLIQKETLFVVQESSPHHAETWFKLARHQAIQWFLNTKAFFGFQFRTVYLSLAYFDKFFSRRSIYNGKIWAIRLLAVACLSLAAKMEELNIPTLSQYQYQGVEFNIPTLSEYQGVEFNIPSMSEYHEGVEFNFESNMIQKMELMVLNTLEWRMSFITPFCYLHYFIDKFFGDHKYKEELVPTAIELIFALSKEINLVEERPSVAAAAAVLAAYDDQLTRKTIDLKMSLISLWGTQENEHIISCYNLLNEIEMRKSSTPKSIISENLSSIESSSSIGAKRRLSYNQQLCSIDKIPRL